MAKKQTGEQQKIVGRVMHEFKHGELESSQGGKVRNPKQAIAIALHEAGSSNQETPAANKRALARTRQGESGPTRTELYERAQKAGVLGRSRMDKAALLRALGA